MKRLYIALAAILLTGTGVRAQEPKRMSLQDCLDYAMQHNYTVKNAQLDVLIQKAQNDQTVAIALPQVSGKADFMYNIKPQSSFIDASTFNTAYPAKTYVAAFPFAIDYSSSASVSASQILFDGSVAVALQARNALIELSKQTGKVSEAAVKYNILKTYYSIIVTYNQLEILRNSLEYARSLEHDISATNKAGFAERIDVERTSVQVNNLVNDSVRVANLAMLTEQVLKYQMGMDINTPIDLADRNLDAHVESSVKLLVEQTEYDRVPEYSLTNTSITLNEYNLKRYKLAALPTLAAFANYGYNYGQFKLSKLYDFSEWKDYTIVGLNLTVPIFSGFKRIAQMDETKLNIEKARNNLDNMKMTIDFQTTQAKTSLRNALVQLQSQKRNISLADDVLQLAQKKYKAGVGSNTEVTQAQTEQLRAQNSYFTTMLDIINAEADLKKALGLL
jgi:outer membrane protein